MILTEQRLQESGVGSTYLEYENTPHAFLNFPGALSVASELENDGTLRALNGGTLTQSGSVASPADSAGVFDAQ